MNDLVIEKAGGRQQTAPSGTSGRRQKIGLQSVGYTVRALDALFLIATGAFAYLHTAPLPGPHLLTAAYAALAVLLIMLVSARGHGINVEKLVSRSLLGRLQRAGFHSAMPFVLTISVSLALNAPDTPTDPLIAWLLVWGCLLVALVAAERIVLHGLLRHWQAQGTTKQVVAVVGSGELAAKLVRWLETTCPDSVEIVGVFDDRNGHDPGRTRLRHLLRGNTDSLIELSRNTDIDRIIVALPHAAERRLITLLQKLKQIPVPISLAPDEVGFATSTSNEREFGGLPVVNIYGRPLEFGQHLAKGLFDRLFALAALTMLAPLLAVTAMAIRLDSKGPILFRQDRFGLGNKVIKVYKFRTMRTDRLDFGGAAQTQRNDSRITRVGNFLRKSSIDELPQLW
ncbi:MAG: sugar transferase, partial [Magnetospirillum sp.]|nr:sugar transferase [Magnetospirillum sp.]